jgi:VIT1/CCC1 family predicted Fe2+/Mn2+ transporter
MKRFIITYLIGALFVLVFYVIFPLVIEGEMLDLSSKRILNQMIPQMMIVGCAFGVVFTIIGAISDRNRSKQETEKAMKEYFEYQLKKEKEESLKKDS